MVQAKFWLRPCRAQRVHQVVDCDRIRLVEVVKIVSGKRYWVSLGQYNLQD
ncbi:MAG: hypothetical protein V7K83_12230 [Nostoc sp.]